ncbi:hypothetical protein Tco_0729954 [Tanacetum coccineum]|uniref:Reverse transcriptase domain-containing protein n=1 Tax=Tanacetum coccineum TaxID=301880 RepID=A0ABQ4YTG8_9ASTR
MIGTPKIENLDRYCDYHEEKGHYTNDCYQLKRQLEAALESEKLNHLVKDVRQRGNNQGRQARNNNTNDKVINMVYVRAEGAAVQVMFEHCFRNLPMTLQARLTQTQMELVGFSGEQLLPMAVPSTMHAMMKFPTSRGIAALVPWTTAIFECRQFEGKQTLPEEQPKERMVKRDENVVEEEVIVNPAIPDQKTWPGILGRKKRSSVKEVEVIWIRLYCKANAGLSELAFNQVLVKEENRLKIEALLGGFPFSVVWTHSEAYHQIQMSEEDKEKTTFYIDHGTYCYAKMPFGLKNAGATYQRLVDSGFQAQLRRNLEADDIKS